MTTFLCYPLADVIDRRSPPAAMVMLWWRLRCGAEIADFSVDYDGVTLYLRPRRNLITSSSQSHPTENEA